MQITDYLPLIKETTAFFTYTMVELTVLFIGISFLVGVINEFLPKEKVKKLLSGRHGKGYIIGSLLGGLTPFCSCSTIPVTVGLLRANAGFGPTMAFLFTSPLVNPIIIPLFLTLLGIEVTIIYASVAIGMTIIISFFLEKAGFAKYVKQDVLSNRPTTQTTAAKLEKNIQSQACCSAEKPVQVLQPSTGIECFSSSPSSAGGGTVSAIPMYAEQPGRWARIFNDAVRQFRNLLPFVILGVSIGSVIHGFLPADMVAKLAGTDNPMAVPVSAFVGIPLYLRASTMVPIAASLIAKGMSLGAVVALIIGGAGASLPEVAMLRGLFKAPLLIAFLTSVMAMAITAGFLVNIVLS